MMRERGEQFRIKGESLLYQLPGDGAVVRSLDDFRTALGILATQPEDQPRRRD